VTTQLYNVVRLLETCHAHTVVRLYESGDAREESPPTCSGRWPDASPERETAGSGTETTRLGPTDDACEPDREERELTRW